MALTDTASQAIQQGGTFNPNDPNSVGVAANLAINSSAPPYQPIIGNAVVNGPNGPLPTGNNTTNALQNEAFYPNLISPNESFTSTPIVSNPSNTLTNNASLGNISYPVTAQATASYANTPTATQAQTYTPAQGVAVQGTVDPRSLVQNQLQSVLSQGTNANGVPDWAQPAVTASEQRTNSLGLGASTMAANAETGAILTTALPVAEQNANTYALMRTQNVTNEQATMLSNTAALNAAAQFNATSVQQNEQFMANLQSQIVLANAAAATAISKYNAGQTNSVNEFQANLNNTRSEFNAANQLVIDQSNVAWQRSINTANTAATNAANQANTKDIFNLQQSALNDLWQQARDEASWALTSSENSQNRALSLVNSSLNRQTSFAILNSQLSAAMYSQLGQFGVNLLGGPSGIVNGVKSLFGGGNGYYSGLINGQFGTMAEGGVVTPEINGVDLTSNTPHISNDASGNTKLDFGKY